MASNVFPMASLMALILGFFLLFLHGSTLLLLGFISSFSIQEYCHIDINNNVDQQSSFPPSSAINIDSLDLLTFKGSPRYMIPIRPHIVWDRIPIQNRLSYHFLKDFPWLQRLARQRNACVPSKNKWVCLVSARLYACQGSSIMEGVDMVNVPYTNKGN